MDTQAPEWDTYQNAFESLAQVADKHPMPPPAIGDCQYYLCLYGENGLTPSEELAMLNDMTEHIGGALYKVEVTTSYWEDVVLFVK